MSNKIEKYGLQDEVRQLAQSGLGSRDIAKHISNDDYQVSHMSVHRFLHSDEVQEMRKEMDADGDLETELRAEVRDKLDDYMDETLELYGIMKKAIKRIVKEGDDYKTIKACKDTLNAIEQNRRNLISKVDEGIKKFGVHKEVKEINYIQVNNMLVAMSRELCENCRKRVIDLITPIERKDE